MSVPLQRLCALLLLSVLSSMTVAAESGATRDLIDVNAPGIEKRLKPSSAQVTTVYSNDVQKPGLIVNIAPGHEDYPGIEFRPQGEPVWDLSPFSYVTLRVTNLGEKSLGLSLRLDNNGDWRQNPWNTEISYIKPGETGSVQVRFGFSFNKPGYPLKSNAIAKVMMFANKSAAAQYFRIESIAAGGPPAPQPEKAPAGAAVVIAADNGASRDLIDVKAAGVEKRFKSSSSQVTTIASNDPQKPGLLINIEQGKEGYPGVELKPEGGHAWDLSAFGHVAVRVTNLGEKSLSLSMRLDNDGDWQSGPSNSEVTYIKPGATGTLKVRFGFSFGKPAYSLKSNAITKILIFAGKVDAIQSFRIEALTAGGIPGEQPEKPPVDPNSIRTKPKDGVIFAPGVKLQDKQLVTTRGATPTLDEHGLRIAIPSGSKSERAAGIKPEIGRWDMTDYLQVTVKLTNTGSTTVTPRARIESNGGPSVWAKVGALAPGASQEIAIPFTAPTIWNGEKGTGNVVTSQQISGVIISAEGESSADLRVDNIRGSMPPLAPLPAWLGKRPPVEGDWYKTFDDEFEGTAVDQSKWKFYGDNFWDKKTHFSKDNVIVSGGFVKLRIEKKKGFHNDDPAGKETDYATGFLETYGKWVQRYGYFESRLKPMTTPGVWPAFWMMPDRGESAGPQWKRADTSNGGMEFDIFEQLTKWGPHRYNIAMHWDGYDKNHKSTGSDKIYVQPDKDGFITVGLLWTPGSLIYYCNGQEVLRWENPRVSTVPADLMFTLPVGGWDNDPFEDAKLPGDFIIDYVRCWQRKDLASDADTVRSEVK